MNFLEKTKEKEISELKTIVTNIYNNHNSWQYKNVLKCVNKGDCSSLPWFMSPGREISKTVFVRNIDECSLFIKVLNNLGFSGEFMFEYDYELSDACSIVYAKNSN
jgi:hypothetical protein